MGRFMRRGLVGHRNDMINGRGRQRDARGPGLVAGDPPSRLHKALLPAPDHGLALANRAHDGRGALAIRRQQNNPRPPNVLLRAAAIPDDRLQALPIGRRNLDGDPLAHAALWHSRPRGNTKIRTFPSGSIR